MPLCLKPPKGASTWTLLLELMLRTPLSTRRAAQGALQVVGPHRPAQSVRRVVHLAQHLLFLVERADADDGAEHLLVPHRVRRLAPQHDGEVEEVLLVARPVAAAGEAVSRRGRRLGGSVPRCRAAAVRPAAPPASARRRISHHDLPRRRHEGSTKRSNAGRSTNTRLRAQQSWPALATLMGALSAAASTSASATTMFGDFPPSSSDTRFRSCEASCMIRLPTAVEPVKDTLRTAGCFTSTSPTCGPGPGRTCSTPPAAPPVRQAPPVAGPTVATAPPA